MKNKKKLIEVLLIIVFTVAGIFLSGYFVRPADTDGVYSQIETFHDLPENELEVIIYGSSHAFRGINPMVMYDEYGIGSYNYSWHWQRINTTRLFIEDSLLDQKPKIMLIEGYRTGEVLIDTDITAEIYYARYIKNKPAIREYIKNCFGDVFERYISFYIPLYAFHSNWSNVTLKSFLPLQNDGEMFKTMGFSASDDVVETPIWDPAVFHQKELDENALYELDKITELCKKNDIEIVFFTVPFEGEYEYGEAMKKYAEENDWAYLDFFELKNEAGINEKDFSDELHLNTSGANKIADYIGRYLKENYELTDMRNKENNIWEQAKSLNN